jgi:CcmD family protein
MDNMSYLFAAYSLIWLGVLIYVFFLLRKEKELRRDIESLKETLKEKN